MAATTPDTPPPYWIDLVDELGLGELHLTELLSLPDEVLTKIAWSVAPNGGRKAASFRLTCRRLGRVLAHVTWASLILPSNPSLQLAPLHALADPSCATRAAVISLHIRAVRSPDNTPGHTRIEPTFKVSSFIIAYLSCLRRLHISGPPIGATATGSFEIHKVRPELHKAGLLPPFLDHLVLENIDLGFTSPLSAWGPNIDHLEVLECRGSSGLHFRGAVGASDNLSIEKVGVKKLDWKDDPHENGVEGFISLASVAATALDVSLSFMGLPVWGLHHQLPNIESVPLQRFTLHARNLFKETPTAATFGIVELLNHLGRSQLRSLTLSADIPRFTPNFAFLEGLRMPLLREVTLRGQAHLLHSATSILNLADFLAPMHFPEVTTVTLVNWYLPQRGDLAEPANRIQHLLRSLEAGKLEKFVLVAEGKRAGMEVRLVKVFRRPTGPGTGEWKGEWIN